MLKCGRVGHIAPQCSDRRTSPSLAARSRELRSRRLRSTGELTCSVKQVSSQLTTLYLNQNLAKHELNFINNRKLQFRGIPYNDATGSQSQPLELLIGKEVARPLSLRFRHSVTCLVAHGDVTSDIYVGADTDKLVLAGRVGAERALLFGLWLKRDARSPAA
ncbi:hypothetical protein EVAR_83454_1 [Eumeta japonica]|uniref:CCHC-type domain-containing protein n=1 Tax=Eumeta variegata TaxID=151549 RepID=A0A4C1TYJ7_EUMVA|nr:hypothetical protein EVAR_83454_1 [Eumeta japonica]